MLKEIDYVVIFESGINSEQMNFEIKITNLDGHQETSLLENYKIGEIESIVNTRYNQIPTVNFDLNFEKENTIFLLFGTIHPSMHEFIKGAEENIFYFSANWNQPRILKRFRFIGISERFYYSRNCPQIYGKKDVFKNMKNTKTGLIKISNLVSYISMSSMNKIGIIEFIFDYLDLYFFYKKQ